LLGERDLDLLAQDLRVQQVLDADPEPHRLVGVAGADAALGRADLQRAQPALAGAVDRHVPGHDQVRLSGDVHVRVRDAARLVLGVAAAFLLAILAGRLAERVRVPPGAIFLLAAALASELFPRLGGVSTRTVERIASVALVVILFDGGMRTGWRKTRQAWVP